MANMGKVENLTRKGKEIDSTHKAQALGKKGGIASGKTKRKNKSMKQLVQMINNFAPKKDIVAKVKKAFPELEDDDITNSVYLLSKQYQKAEEGDTKAFEVIRDTGGEKPTDKIDVTEKNKEFFDSVKIVNGKTSIELK